MADSTLAATYTAMNTAIALELGMSTDPSAWTDPSTAALLNRVRQSAERSVYYAMLPGDQGNVEWSFLNPPATLSLVAGTSTYTLPDNFTYVGAIGPRLVYAAGSGYVSAEKVDPHSLLEAQARESGSTLSAAISSAGATSLTVESTQNFPVGSLPFTIKIDSEYLRVTAVSSTTFTVTRGYSSTTATTHSSGATVTLLAPPKRFAIRPQASTPATTTGQRFEMLVFPTPDAVYTVNYRYSLAPDGVTSSATYPYGGAQHAETFLSACTAKAELIVKGEPGPHAAEFQKNLAASIIMDRRARNAESKQFPVAPAILGTWGWVAQQVGIKRELGANPALWTFSELEEIRTAIQRGVIEVLKPASTGNPRHKGHRWSWLSSLQPLTTSEPQSSTSATVTVTAGVAVLGTGTWPSWAADGTLILDGVLYDVATRDSSTQVTLIDTSLTDTFTGYTLSRYRYALGSTFSALSHNEITFQPGVGYEPIRVVDPDRIRTAYQQSGTNSSYPWLASVRTRTPATTGTVRELILFPLPNAVYQLEYKTKRTPLEYSDGDYLPGGTDHANLFVCAALAQLEPSYMPQFLSELGSSIEQDQLDNQSFNLGLNTDRSDDYDLSEMRRHWRLTTGSLFGGSYP